MMVIEGKRAYDNLHVLHPVFTLVTLVIWIVCQYTLHITLLLTIYTYMAHF